MTLKNLTVTGWLLGALALASGCGKSWPSERPAGPSALSEQTLLPVTESKSSPEALAPPAQKLFNERCAVCHGTIGQGDGPGAVALNPKPRAFADAAWQKSATDELISKTILAGGPAVGKSAGMPPNPDLADKPELVKELVDIVRGFDKR